MIRILSGSAAMGFGFLVARASRCEKGETGAPARTLLYNAKSPFKDSEILGTLEDSFTVAVPKSQFRHEPRVADLARALFQGNVMAPQKYVFQLLNRAYKPVESTSLAVGEKLIGDHFEIRALTPTEFLVTNVDPKMEMNLWLRVYPMENMYNFQIGSKGFTSDPTAAKALSNGFVIFVHDWYSRLLLDNAVRRLVKQPA